MTVNAGSFNRKIAIQRQRPISDGGGGRAMNWQDLAEVWVKIEGAGGNKRFFGDQNEYPATHKLTMRYREDIKSSDRIRYRYERKGVAYERFFSIQNITDITGHRRYLTVNCREGVAV